MTKSSKLTEVAEFKFRPLKKNLSNSFKQIRYSIETGSLPEKKVLDQFLDEVKIMVSYTGFGDEFYDQFLQTCQELTPLFTDKNFDRFSKQITIIRSLKKQCHSRFRHI